MSSADSEPLLADLVVGARGWLHDDWLGSYYPEDIPEEWRLGFYANEFNTLLVPWAQWSESVADLEAGLDDTDDDFHLYLELPARQQSLPAHLSRVAERVTGLVCLQGEPESWQAELANWDRPLLAALPQNEAVFQRFAVFATDTVTSLVLVDGAAIADLEEMRELLEQALQDTGSRLDFIFIDPAPELEAMRNTRMIAELLGA